MTKFGVNSRLIGKKIHEVRMSDDYLVFETDAGPVAFEVTGDCCSHSYFYDFYGADKLRANGPVLEFNWIDLPDPDSGDSYECIQAYGYEIVTESPEWGEQTAVFSFRNSSNGYYGGEMDELPEHYNVTRIVNETPAIVGDWVVLP